MSDTSQQETPDRMADGATGRVDDETRAIDREIWEGGPVYPEPQQHAATRDAEDSDQ